MLFITSWSFHSRILEPDMLLLPTFYRLMLSEVLGSGNLNNSRIWSSVSWGSSKVQTGVGYYAVNQFRVELAGISFRCLVLCVIGNSTLKERYRYGARLVVSRLSNER